MAVSDLSYFSNSTPGEVQLNKFNPADSTTNPKFVVGNRVSLLDGRVYRYAHFGAASAAGELVAQDVSESGASGDNLVIAPASAVAVPGESVKPGAAGSRYVEVTLAAITANQFAGGYLHIEDGTGEGYLYRIKGNTATDNPATGNIRLELYDRLIAALDATSDIQIVGDKHANLEPATATDTIVAGVCLVAQAAGDFGWIQTKGPASVLTDGAAAIGSDMTLSDGAAGQAQIQDAWTEPFIGYALTVSGGAGERAIINLALE